MDTPKRRQDVVVTGISMSLTAMAVFMAKLAVASIPAALIVLLILIPANALIQQQVVRRLGESLNKGAVALATKRLPEPENRAYPALWDSKGKVYKYAYPSDPSDHGDAARIRQNRADYLTAFTLCADSVRRAWKVPNKQEEDGLGASTTFDGPAAVIRGWFKPGASSSRLEFECYASRNADTIRIMHISEGT